MRLSRYAKILALSAHAGLMLALAYWFVWASAPPGHPRWPALLVLAPLVLPLPGLLRAKPYTFAWNSLLVLFYLCLALTEVLASGGRELAAWPVLAASLLAFLGCLFFVRLRKRESEAGWT